MKPKEFIKEYCIKSLVCCFSGGKDSLVMTHYLHSELEGMNVKIHVVFADTGIMLPIAKEFAEDVAREFGWNLTIVEGNFFDKVQKNGMPRMKHRWCCWECKIRPISEFTKTLPPQRCEAVGLRRDESFKRSKLKNQIYYLKKGWVWKYAPILDWTEQDVFHYIHEHDLPMPPHYRLGLRETCMCGVYSNKQQMLILRANFPELWQKILDAEAKFKKKGAAFYFQNKPVYAKDLDKQTILKEKIEGMET